MKTKSQDRAIAKIHDYIVESLGEHEALVIFDVRTTDYGVVWVNAQSQRTDCDEASLRNVLCEKIGIWQVGPRGGIHTCYCAKGCQGRAKRNPITYGWTEQHGSVGTK